VTGGIFFGFSSSTSFDAGRGGGDEDGSVTEVVEVSVSTAFVSSLVGALIVALAFFPSNDSTSPCSDATEASCTFTETDIGSVVDFVRASSVLVGKPSNGAMTLSAVATVPTGMGEGLRSLLLGIASAKGKLSTLGTSGTMGVVAGASSVMVLRCCFLCTVVSYACNNPQRMVEDDSQ
jgi:hypothetical protein